ncbi:Gfo/Idh/MocA family oxidoreductase [Leptolyngbya sp. 7M]|nr:Gfo/Idh/MocA family oxidoreductase [Leptolyngbya sp. 7M]
MRVGLVGTGYAAKVRAESLQADARAQLVAVAGHTIDKARSFSEAYAAQPAASWMELVNRAELDLLVIATINRDHGPIARAALQAGKHVVVEYPLLVLVFRCCCLFLRYSPALDNLEAVHSQHQYFANRWQ